MKNHLFLVSILIFVLSCSQYSKRDLPKGKKNNPKSKALSWKLTKMNYKRIFHNRELLQPIQKEKIAKIFRDSWYFHQDLEEREKKFNIELTQSFNSLTKKQVDFITEEIVKIQRQRVEQYFIDLNKIQKVLETKKDFQREKRNSPTI